MKKFWILSFITIFFFACGGSPKNKDIKPVTVQEDNGMITYKYRVEGLQDSIISDSIWKIIFQVDGIDKLVLSKNDCTAVFTVEPELVTTKLLEKEIKERGGKLIN